MDLQKITDSCSERWSWLWSSWGLIAPVTAETIVKKWRGYRDGIKTVDTERSTSWSTTRNIATKDVTSRGDQKYWSHVSKRHETRASYQAIYSPRRSAWWSRQKNSRQSSKVQEMTPIGQGSSMPQTILECTTSGHRASGAAMTLRKKAIKKECLPT